jgi:hypothetical protein
MLRGDKHFNGLSYSGISILLGLAIPLSFVQRILGHKSLRTREKGFRFLPVANRSPEDLPGNGRLPARRAGLWIRSVGVVNQFSEPPINR